MVAVYVAGGSNVDAPRNVKRAAALLRQRFADIRFSHAYQNAPAGFDGADFINFVAGFTTSEPLADVVAALQKIEAACGRARLAPKWEPRSMDLDILLYGDEINLRGSPRLPRPDLLRRSYMLGPMAEIAPDVVHPTTRRSVGELWREFDAASHPLTPIDLDLARD
ncbi:MAG: 2-amino-4-hydroxy-6-hydroxymethyldihydropteridine diphosphokinase [Steroidobacteraceae bacterium]